MNAIVYLPAHEILSRIHSKQISSKDVMLAFLDQIEKYNIQINAITDMVDRNVLIREAEKKDELLASGIFSGPLHGLPMTVKDGFNVTGLISSSGMPTLKNNIATDDALLVKKLKESGAIIIGKTNLPLFSIDWQSTNSWFGQTNNPYAQAYVAGGSSGGSAAALAAGFTALELGSDAGGSIRVPAHFCGVCGIRPTEGLLSNRGQFLMPGNPQGHRYLTTAGPMARTVKDLLLAMSVLSCQNEVSEVPPVNFNSVDWDGLPLKIAYATTMHDLPIDHDYQHLIDDFLKKLKTDGHILKEDAPRYDSKLAYRINGRLFGYEVAAGAPMPTLLTGIFIFLFILFKYRDWSWATSAYYGVRMSPRNHLFTLTKKEKIGDAFIEFFNQYDLWVTPVASITAFKHQKAGKPFFVNQTKVAYTEALGRFNFNTAIGGHPVVVIPIGLTKTGLPAGIALHGRKWQDKKLLQIADYLQCKLTNGFQMPDLEKSIK